MRVTIKTLDEAGKGHERIYTLCTKYCLLNHQ